MRLKIITLILAMTAIAASAYNITGVVIDETNEPMIKATVRVLHPKDSTAVKGAITNAKGEFHITDVPNGKYLLETSYVGYTPIYKTIQVKGKNINVGTLPLAENAEMLKDVTVTGIKTPIRVMEDTVEFNADSYKTQPNAVVEDLLKRLPGVEVGTDGTITANGKTVTKILVDNKEFFSDDPKVASKQLPVDIVDKLQVVDRKSDLARMTGVDDGEEETVINLTVKKDRKNGWFGSAELGYGTDSRYSGQFNINRFTGGNQVTLLGNFNNINNIGVTDGGSRFSRFGGFGGITDSQSFGLNFNVGKEEIIRVGGDVLYSHIDRDSWRKQNRQYLFTDSTSYYDSENDANDKGHNIRADFRVQWKPDSFNTLDFRPNISLNYNDSKSDTESNTFAGIVGSDQRGDAVNKSLNALDSHGSSFEFGGRLIYNHNFKRHRGRSVSAFIEYQLSNRREKENTYSWNRFFNAMMADNPYDIYDQFVDNHTWSNSVSTRVTWTEPLGDVKKGNFLTVAYRFQYRWNDADKITYDRPLDNIDQMLNAPIVPPAHLDLLPSDVMLDSLSNRFRNDYMNQDIQIGYRHVSKSTNLNLGISLVPQMSKSIDLIDDAKSIPERWVWNYAPFIRYRYKMTKQRSMQIDYNGRSSQPSLTQLQPVADYSNPLNVTQGNPNLDPSFSHNLRLRFQDFNMEAQRSVMVMASAGLTQNAIITRTEFNSTTGGRFNTYENVNGIWNANFITILSFPFKNKNFTFNNHLGGMYNHNVGYSSVGSNEYKRNNSGSLSVNESFGIAFRPDNLEVELRPNYSLQYVSNSVQKSANQTVHRFGGSMYATYYAPFGLVLSTDLNYSARRGYSAGFNTNEWMWNASISYQTLKGKNLTITLRGSDLLQQQSNISRSINANYIDDTLTNSLTRYVMLSVSYKFTQFAKGQQPEMRGGDFRRGGPGRMGPPPGGPR